MATDTGRSKARYRPPVVEQGSGPLAREMAESIAQEEGRLSARRRAEIEARVRNWSKLIPSSTQFTEANAEWLEPETLRELADNLIGDYEELNFLEGHQVRYLLKIEGGKKGGRGTFGKCIVTSGLVKHFGEAEWVIWLAADHCREAEFDDLQVEALLYHELLHCALKGKAEDVPSAKGHDFELFRQEFERYGFWSESAKVAKEAVQGRLALEAEEPLGVSVP